MCFTFPVYLPLLSNTKFSFFHLFLLSVALLEISIAYMFASVDKHMALHPTQKENNATYDTPPSTVCSLFKASLVWIRPESDEFWTHGGNLTQEINIPYSFLQLQKGYYLKRWPSSNLWFMNCSKWVFQKNKKVKKMECSYETVVLTRRGESKPFPILNRHMHPSWLNC